MNKDDAQVILQNVLLQSGFHMSQEPDFRCREPEFIRGIVVKGTLGDVPSFLKIILDEHAQGEVDRTQRIHKVLASHTALCTPEVLCKGKEGAWEWMVTRAVKGKRVIGETRYPESSSHEKREVAHAFALMTKLWPQDEPRGSPEDYNTSFWFSDRFAEWERQGVMYNAFERKLLSIPMFLKAYERVQEIAKEYPDFSMRYTHSHFADTEIRKDTQGRYWLLDLGSTRWKPEAYDAAFFVWHATLSSAFDPPVWVGEVQRWEQAFMRQNVSRQKFRACLIERCIGALLVDIASGRGNIAKHPKTEQTRVAKTFSLLLHFLLQERG